MRPTRRGWAALVIATAAVVLAGAHGPRALNAVAAPLFGAVAFGAVQVWRAGEPSVDCHPVDPGFPDSERTYHVDVTGGGVLDVKHEWPAGLESEDVDAVVVGSDAVETDVTLRDRGRYEIKAPTIRQRDSLGLVGSRVETNESTTAVVYPEIHPGTSLDVFGGKLGTGVEAERQEFDQLREYVPGDPLRDIHWPSSAKGEDFFVAEYEPGDRTETITIAASADAGAVDAMATAAGTFAVTALESGLSVGLSLPGGAIPPGSGRDHESALLSALAAATDGPENGADADVRIHATPAETRVAVGDTTYRFEDLVERSTTPEASEVAAA
jgi:uncharacterized protein (DUF58 family)